MDNDLEQYLDENNFSAKIVNNLPLGLLSFDSEWKINYVNDNFLRFGVHSEKLPENLLGVKILDVDIFNDLSIIDELKKMQSASFFEKELKNVSTIQGGEISIIVKGSPIINKGIFEGGLLIIEDLRISADVKSTSEFQKNDYLERIVNIGCDLLFITNPNGEILYAAGNKITKLSFNLKNIINSTIFQILPQTKEKFLIETLKKVTKLKAKEVIEFEINFDNEIVLFSCEIFPLVSTKKDSSLLMFNLKDITTFEREKEKYLLELEELKQYQIITETGTDAVVGLDLNGKVKFWNKAAESLFNYKRSEVFEKFFGRIIQSFDNAVLNYIVDSIKIDKALTNRLTFVTKDKIKKEGEFTFALTEVLPGKELIVVLCKDITEKAHIEKDLRASEEKFRSIVLNASELICNMDTDGRIIYANPSFIKTIGYSEEELKEIFITEVIAPEFLKKTNFGIQLLAQLKVSHFELPVINKSGSLLYLMANFSTITEGSNSVKFISGIFTDVTEKKETEKELLMMRSIIDASNDGISVESDENIVLANDSFARIFGYEHGSEIIGKNALELVDAEDRGRVQEFSKARYENREAPLQYEFLALRKDGVKFYAEASVTTTIYQEKKFLVLILRDISERKRTQQAIKDSEEKYRNITENIDDFFWIAERANEKLKMMFFTASVIKITGYTQTELLKDPRLFFKMIHPDDLSFSKEKLKKFFLNIYKKTEEFEFRIIHKEGNLVWVRNKLTAIRDRKGIILKIYGLVTNISLQKKAELEVSQSAENLKKLNDTKDRFISIISHDLRTPFSSILGFTDLLLTSEDLTEAEKKQYVGFIRESSQNMLLLVNSLLDWTRLQTGRIKFEPEKVNLKELADKSITSISGFALQKQIRVINKITNDVFVFIDGGLVMQAINNLLSNSLKFTESGGVISIDFKQAEIPRFVEVCVKDTGIGIAEENLGKMFNVDAKFTSEGTHGEKGSGLGLSLVKEIIEKHGGKIWVESELGIGSEFKFTLPKASASILLVDDSNTDRLLYTKILKNIIPDYNIKTAKNGKEALELIKTTSPALIISDHVMPVMNGMEMIKQLVNSDIKGIPPVIILSADIGRGEIIEYNELGIEYVFSKPVNLKNLQDAIDKSLKKFRV
jgi:PAS domain S-box-containing protein